jgi:hypothetical protein
VVGYRTGVEAFGQTIVNSGTIKGTSGYAVQHAKELVNYGVVDSIRVAAAEYCYTILNYGLLESTGTIGDISVNGIKYLTNENAGVILGTVRLNSGGSVANEGHIETGSYSASGFAVAFYDFGYLTNAVDGVIDGGVRTFEDTVINRGTIDGLSGPGELLQRSDLTNQTGGLITGLYGVSDESYATNFGTIEGGGRSVGNGHKRRHDQGRGRHRAPPETRRRRQRDGDQRPIRADQGRLWRGLRRSGDRDTGRLRDDRRAGR